MSKITLSTDDLDSELIIMVNDITYHIKQHVFPNMVKGGYLERIGENAYALTVKGIEKGYTVRERKEALATAPTGDAPTPLDALKTVQGAFSDSIDAVRGTIRQLLVAIIRAELFANTPKWACGIAFNFDLTRNSVGIEARECLTLDCPKPRKHGLVKYLERETEEYLFANIDLLDMYGCIWIRLNEVFEGYVPTP